MSESDAEPDAALSTPYADWLAATVTSIEQALADAEPVRSPHAGAPAELGARVDAAVEAAAGDLIALSHDLHAHPELLFAEHHAVKAIAELVERHDIGVETGVGGLATALRAEVGTGQAPVVTICAEYDALPGIGHACGHNVIAATAAGAFLACAQVADELPGTVQLLGTPGEEGGGGKEYLARAGVFDRTDAAIMLHPYGVDAVDHEWLGVRTVDVVYQGLSAHAAALPFLGRNALDAIVDAYDSLARLRQHLLPGDRVHGIITDGGQKPNIVPERAAGSFFLRSRSVAGIEALTQRAQALFEAAAHANGVRLHLDWDVVAPYLPLRTNHWLAARYAEALVPRGRPVAPKGVLPPELAASTDMGNVSMRVPAIHPLLAIAPPGVTIHQPEFAEWAASDHAEAGVVDGAVGLARTAADFLCDERLRADVRAEFEAAGGVVDVARVTSATDGR
jgi:amidohydrolase